MKAFHVIFLAVLALIVVYARLSSPPTGGTDHAADFSAQSSKPHRAVAGVPEKAREVLAEVRRTGEAPAGYVGGLVFQNREGRLPAHGDYREFDVDPHQGGRNADRLVIEWNSKRAWYTDDHYRTFTEVP